MLAELCDLLGVKLTEIVRDNDDTTREFFDGFCEGVDGFHIQVIGRLIEENDVRVFHCKNGKYDSVC